jgi:hypothetical protein
MIAILASWELRSGGQFGQKKFAKSHLKPVIPATGGSINRRISVQVSLGLKKKKRPHIKINQ